MIVRPALAAATAAAAAEAAVVVEAVVREAVTPANAVTSSRYRPRVSA
jgi:hypothetical protein